MDTIDDVYCLYRMMRKALRKLRYKCRRHNADYYSDSVIPDTAAVISGTNYFLPRVKFAAPLGILPGGPN
jgi:hypothetical protein